MQRHHGLTFTPAFNRFTMAKKKASNEKKSAVTKSPKLATGPMDPELLERLVKLMSANDLSSLDVRDGAQRVSLKRGPQVVTTGVAPATVYQASPPSPGGVAPVAAKTEPKPAADDTAGLKPIKSPMVGTFYAKPSPDAKAFVQVGTVVNEETDVCVIEAMKVFNNIKAETRGTITRIAATDGQTVEFGTVLFWVKPA
jgi:acetyl-CoA carboxylase biotin carboxyl carrier protein